MARLYANENFPLPVVQELRRLGHDIVTVQETGKGDQRFPDNAVLEFAHSERRAVITINRKHFIKLHAASGLHSGIIVCTFDPDFAGQAARIHAAITALPDLAGQLIRVNRPPR